MTAVKAPHHHPRSGPAAGRRVLFLLIAVLATATTLLAASLDAAAQEATATPTQQDLQQLRDEAIANGDPQLELTFEELNDSGVEGTATLYDLGDDRTLVAIEVTGGSDAHPAHIHEGTCGASEPEPYQTLATVDDTGESLSLVDVSLTDLIDGGDYTVDLHLSPSELGTLVVCANIEGTPTPATPAAATPTETASAVPTGEGGQVTTPTVPATTTATAEASETATPEETATVVPTGEGGQVTTTPTATATETTTSGSGTTVDGTGGAQTTSAATATLPLDDYSDIGVTGTVTLEAIDANTTQVTIQLQGDAVTGGHLAHLHPGTCDTLKSDGTIYLANVGADGVSSTTVNISLDALLNEGWSVNVHLSEAEWNVWMVCGYLGDATGGTTGTTVVTPAGGKGEPVGSANAVTAADGTSGVGGKGEPVEPSTIPQSVGIGSTLPWPESPVHAIAWSLAAFALMLAVAGILVRRSEHRQPTRWHRLGL